MGLSHHHEVDNHRRPVAGARVFLICLTGHICDTKKTNSRGEFVFDHLGPRTFSIQVAKAGFYGETIRGFLAREDVLSVYFPLTIAACSDPSCGGPVVRQADPLEPITICQ